MAILSPDPCSWIGSALSISLTCKGEPWKWKGQLAHVINWFVPKEAGYYHNISYLPKYSDRLAWAIFFLWGVGGGGGGRGEEKYRLHSFINHATNLDIDTEMYSMFIEEVIPQFFFPKLQYTFCYFSAVSGHENSKTVFGICSIQVNIHNTRFLTFFGEDLIEKKILRVTSVGHLYVTYFNVRNCHFSQNKVMYISDLHLKRLVSQNNLIRLPLWKIFRLILCGSACKQISPHPSREWVGFINEN